MAAQNSPFVEASYGWPYGSDGWNSEMDGNLVKFSYLHDRNIDAIVSSLPAIVNGKAYFNTTDNRLYFDANGQRYSSVTPKWFEVTLRTTGQVYQFDGTTLNLGTTEVTGLKAELEVSGSSINGYDGARSTAYIPKVGDALDGALIDASRFGVKGDGTDEGARIEAAMASGENIRFQRHMDLKTDRPLATASERQIVDFNGAMLRPIADLGSNYILTLSSNFSEVRELLLVNDSLLNAKGVLHSGFRTSLVNPNITGTTLGHVVAHTGAEATLSGGKIKGGTQSGLFISAPDSNVQFVYIEGNAENGMQSTVGSIVANNVHCYNNGKSGFRFTGADFSVFHQLYADTNGENGIYLDQTKNTEFYSAWGFKSNQSLAGQKYELLLTDTCVGNTFYGFRAGHGSDAAKTAKAMDIGNSNNLFVGAYSQTQDILRRVDAGADITNAMFIEAKGVLAKYNKQPHTDKKHLSLTATGSGSFSFVINRSLAAISSDVFVFELEVVGRDAAGSGSLVIDKVVVPIAAGTTGSAIIKTHVVGNDIFTYTLTSSADNSVVIDVASSSASSAQLSGVLRPMTSARSVT